MTLVSVGGVVRRCLYLFLCERREAVRKFSLSSLMAAKRETVCVKDLFDCEQNKENKEVNSKR